MRTIQTYVLFLSFFLLITVKTNAQGCLPDGLLISSQSEIDQFQTNYSGCTKIIGDLTVFGANIINLNGLSSIQTIGGNLTVDATNCTSLQGLQNLVQVGGNVYFPNNPEISNLTGLTKLKKIGGELDVSYSSKFINFSGLNAIEQIGGALRAYKNELMTDISNLTAVDSLGGFNVFMNPEMTSMSGLVNLKVVTGSFNCSENNMLANFNQLSNLEKIGDSFILNANPILTSLSGFQGMTSITTNNSPEIIDNLLLTNCSFPAMCSYLSHGGVITLSGNGSGCNSAVDVISSCTTTNVSTREIPNFIIQQIGKQLIVKSDKPIKTIVLRNMSGAEILRSKKNSVSLDTKNIHHGVYFVDVDIENQNIVKKIVVGK